MPASRSNTGSPGACARADKFPGNAETSSRAIARTVAVLELTGSAAWWPAPSVRVDAAGGYSLERTESIVWRSATRWVQAGVSVALPYGFTVGGGAEQRWTRYEGRWGVFTPGGGPRRDRTRILRATLLNRSLTVFGFSPQIALAREARNTNAQLYDYRRTRTEIRFQRQF